MNNKQFQLLGERAAPGYAVMKLIGAPIPHAEYGPAFVVLQSMTAPLDGYRLKQILFKNCDVLYSGGAVVLNHVYFINCRFFWLTEYRQDLGFSECIARRRVD